MIFISDEILLLTDKRYSYQYMFQDGTVHKLVTAVEGSQEVEIYDLVSVIPKIVVLPWDASANSHYHYQLSVSIPGSIPMRLNILFIA